MPEILSLYPAQFAPNDLIPFYGSDAVVIAVGPGRNDTFVKVTFSTDGGEIAAQLPATHLYKVERKEPAR